MPASPTSSLVVFRVPQFGGKSSAQINPCWGSDQPAALAHASYTRRNGGLDAAEPHLRQRGRTSCAGSGGGLCSRDNEFERNYCGAMRLRSDTAASTASLADYLRRCGCLVEVIDRRIIDAAARPQSFAAPHAHIE